MSSRTTEGRDLESVGLGVAIGILVLVGGLTLVTTGSLVETARWVDHTHQTLAGFDELRATLAAAKSATLGYVLTGDEERRHASADGIEKLGELQPELRALVADNPVQLQRLDQLVPLLSERVHDMSDLVALRSRSGGAVPGSPLIAKVSSPDLRMRSLLTALADEERRLLRERQQRSQARLLAARATQIAGTLISFALLWIVFRALRRAGDRRRRSELAARESENRLATTLQSIGDGVIVTDESGRITRLNHVAEELTGWSAVDARDRPFGEVFVIVNELTRQAAPNPIERVLREGIVVGLADHTVLIARDGSERPIADSAAPIREGGGALLGTVLVFRDMTQERDSERDLRAARDELEQRVAERTAALLATNRELQHEIAERQRATEALKRSEEQFRQAQKMEAVGRLAGGIAHDFNNVLSVILSYSDLLSRDLPEGDQMRGDLDEIHKAGERAAALTRQLLAFSRQQVLDPRIVDLNDTLGGMGKLLDRVLGEDIELHTRTDPELKWVKVDPGQIEQVIMNLVVNARDAMPQGGELTLETANVDLDAAHAAAHSGVTPGPHVMLVVRDTGSGMTEATQVRAFEPFFTTKEQGKGTGLGLSTVLGIVQQSGGSIALHSVPGEGSTFRLYFPVAARAESSRAPTAVGAQIPGGNETILLVEDEGAVRVLARNILSKCGYQVLEAGGAEEALVLSERFSGRIHLILTDVVMPKIGGPELAARLTRLRPEARVLFMSGYTDDTVLHHGILKSGMAFLQKPLTPDALARKVREVLDGLSPMPRETDRDSPVQA